MGVKAPVLTLLKTRMLIAEHVEESRSEIGDVRIRPKKCLAFVGLEDVLET